MGEIRPYNKDKSSPLEQFMIEVAMLCDCLPDFTIPTLNDGNSHIKAKIESLLDIEKKYNNKIQSDAEPCSECSYWQNHTHANYCGSCGIKMRC